MRSALTALWLLACNSTAPAPLPAPVPVAEPEPPEIRLSMTANDTVLREVAVMLSEQTGQAVIIGSQVEPVADCLRLTILNPSPVPASRVVEQIRSGLARSGVTLEVGESELRFIAAEGAEPRCPPTTRADLPTADTPRTTPEAFVEGVRKVSDTEWTITRAAVDALIESGSSRSARVIPHEEDGEVVGIKLYGIRRSSPLGLLGLQNGDLVRSVNGHEMADPTAALEAYATMRGASRAVVLLDRRGQPRTHTYRIVD